MKIEEGFFEGVGEKRLFYSFFRQDKARTNPSVVLLHGLGEHSGRYREVTQIFCEHSFSVALLDHRGHGRSSGQRGHVHSFTNYLWDVYLLIQKLNLYRPLIFGHSLGGLIAIRFVQTFPQKASALVLSSPFLGIQMEVPGWKIKLGKFASRLWPQLAMPSEINPNHISHDEEVIRACEEDPLVHEKVTARWFTTSMIAQKQAFFQAGNIQIPLLIQQAGGDLLCKPEKAEQFFNLVGSNQKTWKSYAGFYHEIFNEKERQMPQKDLQNWLASYLSLS